jgi:hypothetical protein
MARGPGAPKGSRNASGNRGGDGAELTYIEGTWDKGPKDSHPYRAYQLSLLLNSPSLPNLAKALGISRQTAWRWRDKYPNFKEAVELGGLEADGRVVRGFYRSAVGYKQKRVKVVYDKDIGFKEHEYTDFVEPNPTAQERWLALRHPDKWAPRNRISFESKDEARKVLSEILGVEPEDLPE